MKKAALILFTVFVLAGAFSCKKQDEIYKDFVVAGGLRYPQKPDSLRIQSGWNRILVQWLKPVDPSVVRARIFWNTGQDSLDVDLSNPDDTIKVILNDMEENTYSIAVYTYDGKGNRSVASELSGSSYGSAYASSLADRSLVSAGMLTNTVADFTFGSKTSELVYTEIKYKSTSGEYKTVRIPVTEKKVRIMDLDNSEPCSYRSVFLPKGGIDYIEKEWTESEGPLPEDVLVLPKGPWTHVPLPTDTYSGWGGLDWLFNIPKLWDGDDHGDDNCWAGPGNGPREIWFTFDFGYKVSLRKMQMFHRVYEVYSGDGVRHFQIWGNMDPNPDGSWDDSWYLLGDFEPYKPSGYQPDGSVGAITDEDRNYWSNVNEFTFAKTDKVPDPFRETRCIRVKLLDSFNTYGTDSPTASYVLAELYFSGMMTDLEERDKYYKP